MSEPAWSFSVLRSFDTCPKKHYHTRVLKDVKEPEGEAARWGMKVHKAFELRVKNGTPLPPELMGHEPVLARFAGAHGVVTTEQQIALTRDFKPTQWFAKDVWMRAVIDLCIINKSHALVVDYKTGKQSDDFDQLELTAAVVMTLNPQVLTVTGAYLWLKDEMVTKDAWARSHVPGIWQRNIERLTPLNAAHANSHWPAKPNGLCRKWCPVTFCPHNGK